MPEIIIPVAQKKYSELSDKVKAMVAERLDKNMEKAYNVKGIVKEYKNMLDQVNPAVVFYVENNVPKHRLIDTKEGKLAQILGSNLANFAKFNPDLMNRVLTQIINRD